MKRSKSLNLKSASNNVADQPKPAVEAVFGTTELLEAILVHLDFTTLQLSQSVSARFRDVVLKRKALQTKLFLLPASSFHG